MNYAGPFVEIEENRVVTIKEQLSEELKDAMKAKDVNRRDVIRMIESEVSIAKSAAGFQGEINDDLYRQVIASYSKKMDKARAEYLELGPRGEEMARKLGWEVDYLSRWLPTKLDQESTQALVRETIADLGVAGDPKAAGRVIGHIMKNHKDEVDGGLVRRLVASALSET
ncbi:MAG TPA: GatB/YqeY domain-containing protein [Acidimicrobiia bacterium]|nr:GatB/YqeY domain-containing protein [Acidimicrobiia bacterium]